MTHNDFMNNHNTRWSFFEEAFAAANDDFEMNQKEIEENQKDIDDLLKMLED